VRDVAFQSDQQHLRIVDGGESYGEGAETKSRSDPACERP